MQTPSKIAVVGANGRVGHHVVDVLKARGHEVVPMSRAYGVDVITEQGLAEAMVGVECIIDVSSGLSPRQEDATQFFTMAARNLHKAGEQAGVQRLVVVSIIGTDQFTAGYNAAKFAHERVVVEGPIPVRIVRAAQFHEFVPVMMDWGRHGDVCYVRKMRTQLVAARTVAEALVDVATGPDAMFSQASAAAPALEIAGPREESLVEMAKLVASRRGDPVQIEGMVDTTDPDSDLYEAGTLLPGTDAKLAGPTFAEWLDANA